MALLVVGPLLLLTQRLLFYLTLLLSFTLFSLLSLASHLLRIGAIVQLLLLLLFGTTVLLLYD
ncbi:hypothetical protein A3709_12455 [Halioglobus sp. HI00S01]|nr:hypothetical protein A3709_12455 [Halioglobus sp. HI00S01]